MKNPAGRSGRGVGRGGAGKLNNRACVGPPHLSQFIDKRRLFHCNGSAPRRVRLAVLALETSTRQRVHEPNHLRVDGAGWKKILGEQSHAPLNLHLLADYFRFLANVILASIPHPIRNALVRSHSHIIRQGNNAAINILMSSVLAA